MGRFSFVCNKKKQIPKSTETLTKDVLGIQQKKPVHKSGVCVILSMEVQHMTFLGDAGYSVSIINTDIYLGTVVSQ